MNSVFLLNVNKNGVFSSSGPAHTGGLAIQIAQFGIAGDAQTAEARKDGVRAAAQVWPRSHVLCAANAQSICAACISLSNAQPRSGIVICYGMVPRELDT